MGLLTGFVILPARQGGVQSGMQDIDLEQATLVYSLCPRTMHARQAAVYADPHTLSTRLPPSSHFPFHDCDKVTSSHSFGMAMDHVTSYYSIAKHKRLLNVKQ